MLKTQKNQPLRRTTWMLNRKSKSVRCWAANVNCEPLFASFKYLNEFFFRSSSSFNDSGWTMIMPESFFEDLRVECENINSHPVLIMRDWRALKWSKSYVENRSQSHATIDVKCGRTKANFCVISDGKISIISKFSSKLNEKLFSLIATCSIYIPWWKLRMCT